MGGAHLEVRLIGGSEEEEGFVYLHVVRAGESLVIPSIGRTKSVADSQLRRRDRSEGISNQHRTGGEQQT